ncbi:MAG: hypothetical protein V1867_07725 [Candidatus Falkowbacteria bacterium]
MKIFFLLISWLKFRFEKKEPERVMVTVKDCGGCGRCPLCFSLNEFNREKFRPPL